MKQEYRADLDRIKFLYEKGMLPATTALLMFVELRLKVGWNMRYIPRILSEETGIPVKSIYKAIKRLTTDGWIVITTNRLGDLLIERGPTSCAQESQSEVDSLTPKEEVESHRGDLDSQICDNSRRFATTVADLRQQSPEGDLQSPEGDFQSPRCENRSPEAAQGEDCGVPSTFSLLSSYFSSTSSLRAAGKNLEQPTADNKESEDSHRQFELARKEVWELLERKSREWKQQQQSKRGIQNKAQELDLEETEEINRD